MAGNGRRLTAEQRDPLIARARQLRGQGLTLARIAEQLGVSDRTIWIWTQPPEVPSDKERMMRKRSEHQPEQQPEKVEQQGKAEQGKAEQQKAEHQPEQGKAEQDQPEQGKAEVGNPLGPNGEYVGG